MKTNFFLRSVVLMLTATALMLPSCKEDEFVPSEKSADFDSLLTPGTEIINGTLYLKSVDDNQFSAFSFGENNPSGTVKTDEIVLHPNHQYQCIFVIAGMNKDSNQLNVVYSTNGNLLLTISENNEATTLFQGQITNWQTGGQSTGMVTLTVSNWKYGMLSIDLPVNITSDLD